MNKFIPLIYARNLPYEVIVELIDVYGKENLYLSNHTSGILEIAPNDWDIIPLFKQWMIDNEYLDPNQKIITLYEWQTKYPTDYPKIPTIQDIFNELLLYQKYEYDRFTKWCIDNNYKDFFLFAMIGI